MEIYDRVMKMSLSVEVEVEREPPADLYTPLQRGVMVRSCPFSFPRTEKVGVFVVASAIEVEEELGCWSLGR